MPASGPYETGGLSVKSLSVKSFIAVVSGFAAGAAGARGAARQGIKVEKLAEAVTAAGMRAVARLTEDVQDIVAEARAQHAARRKEQRRVTGFGRPDPGESADPLLKASRTQA